MKVMTTTSNRTVTTRILCVVVPIQRWLTSAAMPVAVYHKERGCTRLVTATRLHFGIDPRLDFVRCVILDTTFDVQQDPTFSKLTDTKIDWFDSLVRDDQLIAGNHPSRHQSLTIPAKNVA